MRVLLAVAFAGAICTGVALAQETGPLTPRSLQAQLASNPTAADAERLAERIRQAFGGKETLLKGAQPIVDELAVAWAIELPNWKPSTARPVPRIWRPVGNAGYDMTRVGGTSRPFDVTAVPVETSADRTCAGVHVGWRLRSNAMTPVSRTP